MKMRKYISSAVVAFLSLTAWTAVGAGGATAQSGPSLKVAQKTPVPSACGAKPHPERDGKRYRDPVSGAIYLVMSGLLRQIPDPTTYQNLFVDDSGMDEDPDITCIISLGTPLTEGAFLVQTPTDVLFLFTDGETYYIDDPAAVPKYNFDLTKVRPWSTALAASIYQGDDID